MRLTAKQATSAIGFRQRRVYANIKIKNALKGEPSKADLRAMLTQAVHNTVKEKPCFLVPPSKKTKNDP